ncbi:hypothetical protein ACQKM2_08070 [Streptomyces sp. NPDC004126]|uniref:hypothetical protein n=1 Tax=Streptomyces sp. NPDC004126 TaxID=3390695 RepID=UPI003D02F09C
MTDSTGSAALPYWQDPKYGAKVQAALWLETKVGVGGVFTKAELREAFPNVAQIDRRVRELRDHNWQIDTHREDPSLKQQEQKYVARGAEIWLPGQAAAKQRNTLTSTQRAKVWSDDSFLCRTCGIGVGEKYPDGSSGTSQLAIARRSVLLADGTSEEQLVTVCGKCVAGGTSEVDLATLLAEVGLLTSIEKTALGAWIDAGQRTRGPLEQIWGILQTLPEVSRKAVRAAVQQNQ